MYVIRNIYVYKYKYTTTISEKEEKNLKRKNEGLEGERKMAYLPYNLKRVKEKIKKLKIKVKQSKN